jgi:hypothetical protein
VSAVTDAASVLEHASVLTNDLPLLVRQYALLRERGNAVAPPVLDAVAPEVADLLRRILGQSFALRDLLLDATWPYVVFGAYCTGGGDAPSLLCSVFPAFGRMNTVRRAANNLYKRDGWGLHVVMGLYVSCICIPSGRFPSSMPEREGNLKRLFSAALPEHYRGLDDEAIAIFRLGTLMHDLGVVDGVEGHDVAGGKYVASAMEELGLDEEWLSQGALRGWRKHELADALRTFVFGHALPTKFFGEYGPRELRRQAQGLCQLAESRGRIGAWARQHLAESLGLFALGDVASVREEYLSHWKAEATLGAAALLGAMMNGESLDICDEKYGATRLCEALGTQDPGRVSEYFCEVADQGMSASEALAIIGGLERMDFSLTALRQVPTPSDGARMLYRIVSTLNDLRPWRDSGWREIRWSPNLAVEWLSRVSGESEPGWRQQIRDALRVTIAEEKCVVFVDGSNQPVR